LTFPECNPFRKQKNIQAFVVCVSEHVNYVAIPK
jgi:hypothetical protein